MIDSYFNRKEQIAIFLIFICLSAFMPLSLGIMILVFSPNTQSTKVVIIGAALVVFSFILMNLNKGIVNDLVWYSQHYLINNNTSVSSVFDGYRFGVEARWTEPLYHLFSYYLSNISNGNYTIFVITVTTIIYGGSLYALFNFIKNSQLTQSNGALLIIFFLFFGVIFTQSLHLIRQYIACTLLLISLVFLSKEQFKLASFFTVLAFLTHNSTIVVSILFFNVFFIYKFIETKQGKLSISLFLSTLLALFYIFAFVFIGDENRLLIDDGSVSPLVKLIDLLLFIVSVFFFYKLKRIEKIGEIAFYIYFSFCIFLFVLHYSHFLSLRYYFFLDFFRWIAVYVLLRYFSFDKGSLAIVSVLLVILGAIYLNLRISSSPFDYGYSFLEYLIYPLNRI
jgi:hypothetical protein